VEARPVQVRPVRGRRAARGSELLLQAGSGTPQALIDEETMHEQFDPTNTGEIPDDRVRLMFTWYHPLICSLSALPECWRCST